MTDDRSARLLGAAVTTLRDEILPTVTDPAARIKIDHVTRLLWDVSARLSKRAQGLRAFLDDATVDPPGADADLAALERARDAVEQDVARRLPELVALADRDGGAALSRIVAMERAFYISQDPDVAHGSTVVYRGGRIEGREPDQAPVVWPAIDAATLTAYLRGRAGRIDLSATEVSRIPGGFSKETIFFTRVEEATGTAEPLVIRKDLPVTLIDKTVADEFPLLRALFAAGFPVAEPLWLESDRELFGGAFLVSRRVSGSSDASRWTGDPARSRAACEALARVLATLHGYAPTDLGIDPEIAALSAGVHMEREIARWHALFQRTCAEPFPLQELPFVWLRANIPAALYDRPARVLHGDIGFHNLMFDDVGRISAVLDWEFSTLGDPMQDLCFARQFVEPLMPWDAFMAIYRAAGGAEPCEAAAFFYRLWTKTRNATGCVHAQTIFDRHMPDETRFALAGHVFAPYMFVDQCETLLDHLAGKADV